MTDIPSTHPPTTTGKPAHTTRPRAAQAARAHVAAAMRVLADGYPTSTNPQPPPAIVQAARRRLDEVQHTLVAALALLDDYDRTRTGPGHHTPDEGR